MALADTGVRIGELEWLTWEDIDLERNLILIRQKAGWKPKSGDARSYQSHLACEAFSNLDLAGFAGCLRQLRQGSIRRGIIRSQSVDC